MESSADTWERLKNVIMPGKQQTEILLDHLAAKWQKLKPLLAPHLEYNEVIATVPGCLHLGKASDPHSSRFLIQIVHFFYSGHPSSIVNSSGEEAHRSPSVHSHPQGTMSRREGKAAVWSRQRWHPSSSFELQSPWCDTPLQTVLPSPSLSHPSQTSKHRTL